MKKKISIIVSVIVLLFIGLIVTARIANAPTKKIITFEKPEDYKEVIDNSAEQSSIQQTTSNNPTIASENKGTESTDVILGSWTGEMGGKTLTIVVEKVTGTELIGYNILGTNKRPIKGTYKDGEWAQSCSKAFDAILNEPGDDKWDGVFTIKFVGYEDTNDNNECQGNLKGQEASGEWKSNNGKMKKEFNLTKK